MSHANPPRVLFVSYLFPPAGGVGTQRVTKFIKYLPGFGWNSSVLTVSNPSVPLLDESLARDIPANTIIRRARTLEPGYAVKQAVSGGKAGASTGNPVARLVKSLARRCANLVLQPDAQILWHPHALREGRKLLAEIPHQAIIATGPPFSSLLLGAKLARESGLPLILDYRDEWDISNAYWENKGQGRLSNAIQHWQQSRAVRSAEVLLATTPSSADSVEAFARRAGSSARSTFIYNGFDPDDYAHSPANFLPKAPDRFRLAFIGTLWNLNSIQPVVEALRMLQVRSPELCSRLELLVAGRRMPDQEAQLDRLMETSVRVTRLPFVSHAEAIQLMRSADSLLMLNSDLPQAQRIINAKTFEYMAARRPMFVVAPQGDVWNVVRALPGTVLCPPGDVSSIAESLASVLEQHRCGVTFDQAQWNISQFERRHLTSQLAELLNEVSTSGAVTPQAPAIRQSISE